MIIEKKKKKWRKIFVQGDNERIILSEKSNNYHTIFILINTLGVLQFTNPKNNILEIYKKFNGLKPFWVALSHIFP